MCPITVALELGGYFHSYFVAKVVIYPALISSSSVENSGKKRDAW